MLLWQKKESEPERYRLWPHQKGLVLMIRPDLIENADVPLWQTSAERIQQWRKDSASAEPTISEWEGISDPMQCWGFGGVGRMGGLNPSDDPGNEWIPFLFPFYPAEDRAGRQRALDISATLTHTLYWLNAHPFNAEGYRPSTQLMLIQTMTGPSSRGCNLTVDLSAGFRRWLVKDMSPAVWGLIPEAGTEAVNLLLPARQVQRGWLRLSFSASLKETTLRLMADEFTLNTSHVGAENEGFTLESVEVDTPVRQLILLRTLAMFWALYYYRRA